MPSSQPVNDECPDAGVVMAPDSVDKFRAAGVGSFTLDGGSKVRGVIYFETATPSLSRLNGMCVVCHWGVEASGNASSKLWEWN